MKYSEIKNKINKYYKHMGNIDNDNIIDVNDHIIDEHVPAHLLENNITEFYVTTAMCSYMVNNNLYDEYFFNAFNTLFEEYSNLNSLISCKEKELDEDIELINESIKKDKIKEEYYETLSSLYDNK